MTVTKAGGFALNTELVSMLNDLDSHVTAINQWLDGAEANRMSATLLAAAYVGVKDFYEQFDEIRKKLNVAKERMSYQILPRAFEDEGQTTVTLSSGHRVTISSKLRASIGEDKLAAYDWLRENEFGEVITETVNASTLSALAKELAERGSGLPDELFSTSVAQTTSVTKVRKS